MDCRWLFFITLLIVPLFTKAQPPIDSSGNVLKFTHEAKDLMRYIGPGERIHYQLYSDSSRRQYAGTVINITDSDVLIDSVTHSLSDIEMMLSPQYRHARHSQEGLMIFAGAILSVAGGTLLIAGGRQEKIVGFAGLVLGLPILYRAIRAYFVTNHYKMDRGWEMEVIPLHPN